MKAVPIGKVRELAPVKMGILEDPGLFSPLWMVVPKTFADVRQLEPGIYENAFPVADFDQPGKPRIIFRVRLEIVPGGDVQGGNAGSARSGSGTAWR